MRRSFHIKINGIDNILKVLLWLKVVFETVSVFLGAVFSPLYNIGLPVGAYYLGRSSRVTISGVTAANHKRMGCKSYTYYFIEKLFWFDPKHMDNAYRRFVRYEGL